MGKVEGRGKMRWWCFKPKKCVYAICAGVVLMGLHQFFIIGPQPDGADEGMPTTEAKPRAIVEPPHDVILKKSTEKVLEKANHFNNTQHMGTAKKVLMMTYMRGGSSLLGEAFNQNPDAFYWFEPLDGAFSHLYGTEHGWHPMDIYHNRDNTIRPLDEEEKKTVTGVLRDIFTCDVQSLPADVTLNTNALRIEQNKMLDYQLCYRGKDRKLTTKGVNPCKSLIKKSCPRSFTPQKELVKCRHDIHNSRGHLQHLSVDTVSLYRDCMGKAKDSVSACILKLEKACSSSHIRAIKAIRMRAEILDDVVKEVPDLKVVAYFRDPRAVVYSRSHIGLMSRASGKSLIKEGAMLCARMKEDLATLQTIQQRSPDSVIIIKYENLIQDPVKSMQEVYQFLGEPVHKDVENWFVTTQNGTIDRSQDMKSAHFKTSRQNSTQLVESWRGGLKEQVYKAITAQCMDILNAQNYEL